MGKPLDSGYMGKPLESGYMGKPLDSRYYLNEQLLLKTLFFAPTEYWP